GRLLGVHGPRRRLLGPDVGAGDLAVLGRRRKLLHDQVEERVAADRPRGARAEHWHDLARADTALERLAHRRLVERALLEILREQVVVGLRGRLHELLAPTLRAPPALRRPAGR